MIQEQCKNYSLIHHFDSAYVPQPRSCGATDNASDYGSEDSRNKEKAHLKHAGQEDQSKEGAVVQFSYNYVHVTIRVDGFAAISDLREHDNSVYPGSCTRRTTNQSQQCRLIVSTLQVPIYNVYDTHKPARVFHLASGRHSLQTSLYLYRSSRSHSNAAMTLHWWMHWFWVTLLFTVILGAPTTQFTTALKVQEDHGVRISETAVTPILPGTNNVTGKIYRVSKAAGIESPRQDKIPLRVKPVSNETANSDEPQNLAVIIRPDNKNDNETVKGISNNLYKEDKRKKEGRSSSVLNITGDEENAVNIQNKYNNSSRSLSSSLKKDSKITRILNGDNKTSRLTKITGDKFKTADDYRRKNNTEDEEDDRNLAVLPLRVKDTEEEEEGEETTQTPSTTNRFKLVLDKTKFIPSTNVNDDNDEVENLRDGEAVETRMIATAASILQGAVSESPRLSRARSAYAGDYQQQERDKRPDEQAQERLAENSGNATTNAIDVAAVTGSCLATLVLLGTVGSLGFVMYRRRYLNPPQTLNSDKCSNPDSSGYIDDSTIRDNSEEMYSLDNDSFLNSLEAMTIQNYWTDSVKHTKL
ncbi:uncharacterized protein LOC124411414 [Diprion similis]|uniref:uncharacterized protein LOC124411414 n=1 Tax=Diprion similis TaxID=362088 RepID=UPI001EF805EB|nr:uncharacterized protein LOC124411414 [Diprion similis]